MTGDLLIFDVLLRGANLGAALVVSLVFLMRRPLTWRHALGAAFAAAAAAYLLASSDAVWNAAGRFMWPVQFLAIIGPVLFWWFALTLFDDGFQIRWPFFLPLISASQVFVAHFLIGRDSPLWAVSLGVSHATMAVIYGHAIFTALRFLNDDLIEGRRRFRIVFAIAVSLVGLAITAVESFVLREPNSAPVWLQLFQAGGILVLTLGFAVWLLGMRVDVLDGRKREEMPSVPATAAEPHASATLRAADRPAYVRLVVLMEEGVWKEEGLTVAALAGKVGVPAHQLRGLINGGLGFRNFSAFLNEYRLAAAKRALADTTQPRRQIIQIALDVGFGSIAPFNRAFKEATGVTPTEFRKAALGEA